MSRTGAALGTAAFLVAAPSRVLAAAIYVDNRHGELDPARKVSVANPQAVQLLFAFQTDGEPNVRATNEVKEQVTSEVRSHFEGKVYATTVPRNVRLSEAPSFGKPILLYDVASKGARSYFDLAREFLARQQEAPAAAAGAR